MNVNLAFWPSISVLLVAGILFLLLLLRFAKRKEKKYVLAGWGVCFIGLAMIIQAVFDMFSIFETYYWIFIEILYITGAILFTRGILSKEK